jgi:hypothetical protein
MLVVFGMEAQKNRFDVKRRSMFDL